MFIIVFFEITKSFIRALKLGKEIIGINNFSIKNFEINAFSSVFVISLNLFLIKIDIILQIYFIFLLFRIIEFGNSKYYCLNHLKVVQYKI